MYIICVRGVYVCLSYSVIIELLVTVVLQIKSDAIVVVIGITGGVDQNDVNVVYEDKAEKGEGFNLESCETIVCNSQIWKEV